MRLERNPSFIIT